MKKIVVLITILSVLCCKQSIQADPILDPSGWQEEEKMNFVDLSADRSDIDDYQFHEGLSITYDHNRADLPSAPTIDPAANPAKIITTWLQPLIIDDFNPQFKNSSIIKFHENINFKPAPNYVFPPAYAISYPAAIIINKSNVTIDLSSFTLSLDPSSVASFYTYRPIYGISINPGCKNVKIVSSVGKGTIFGFSGYAIYGLGLANGIGNDPYGQMIQNLVIDNLLLTQNISGIYINQGLRIAIANTNIIYNYSPRVSFGIYLSNILNAVIDSCAVDQNTSTYDMVGVYLLDTIKVLIKDTQINLNQSTRYGNCSGFHIATTSSNTSYSNIILNCTAINNSCALVAGLESRGFYIGPLSHHNKIDSCIAFRTCYSPLAPGATAPLTNPIAYGIKVGDGAGQNLIHKNQSEFNNDYGFYDASAVSSCFYSENVASFNGTANYYVILPSATGSPTFLVPTIVYPDDLSAWNYTTPNLENIAVQAR